MPRIMLVDDEKNLTYMLEETLRSLDYDVVGTAISGAEAVAMAGELNPDLILMETVMPGELDGIDAAATIKADMDIPILFLTGHSEPELLNRAKQINPHGYILKTCQEDQIRTAIDVALFKKKIERKAEQAHEELKRTVKDQNVALRRKNEQLTALLNASADLAFLADLQGNVIASNGVTAELFNVPLDTFSDSCVYDLMSSALAEVRKCKAETVIRTGKPCRFEENRKGITFEVTIYPVFDEQGKVVQLAIYGRDFTDQRQAEEAVRKRKKEYRRLLDTMNEGFRIIDENLIMTYVNNRFCEMLGYGFDDLIGAPLAKFVDETKRKVLMEQLARRKRGESGSYELTLIRKDGQKIETINSSRPDFDDQGCFRGTYAVLTDITQLKSAQKALEQKEEELERRAQELEETNAALKVLLKRRDEDRLELEEKVVANVTELVKPYLAKLKLGCLDGKQTACVGIIESNLREIISPLARKLASKLYALTPREIRVAGLVKGEMTSKEIARLLNISIKTVEYYRDNIRKKLGIKNEKINLRSHLLSLR